MSRVQLTEEQLRVVLTALITQREKLNEEKQAILRKLQENEDVLTGIDLYLDMMDDRY